MTIGTPVLIGSTAVSDPGTTSIWTCTLSAGAAVGDRVWVWFCSNAGDTVPTSPTFATTDSKGNTWTTHRVPTRDSSGTTVMLYAASAPVTVALAAADVVTITQAASTYAITRKVIAVVKCSGVDTLDQQATSDPGASSALLIGPTATTDTGVELVFGVWASGVRAVTPGSGYTELAELATAVGTTDRQLYVEYKITAGVGTQSATATLASSTTNLGSLSTWRQTASAGDDATHFLYDGVDWQPMFAELL